MKVTNNQVLNGHEMLNMIAPAITDNVIRMQIILITNAIEPVITAFRQVQGSIIDKYAEKEEDGKPKANDTGNVVWVKETIDDANKEIIELGSMKVDVQFTPIDMERFVSSIDYDKLPADPADGEKGPAGLVDVVNGVRVLKYGVANQVAWLLKLS